MRRIPIAIAVLALVWGGCMVLHPNADGAVDSGSRDDLDTICRRRTDSAMACSQDCFTAVDSAQAGPCSAEVGVLSGDPEVGTFNGCVSGCSIVQQCSNGLGLADCTCIAACVRQRSSSFQSTFTSAEVCVSNQIAGACY